MNCFEARKNFRALWRKNLAPARRSEMIGHLSECATCDGAFRVFALTAPALHSDPPRADAVMARADALVAAAPARTSRASDRGASREPFRQPTIRGPINRAAIGASISIVAAAGLAA